MRAAAYGGGLGGCGPRSRNHRRANDGSHSSYKPRADVPDSASRHSRYMSIFELIQGILVVVAFVAVAGCASVGFVADAA